MEEIRQAIMDERFVEFAFETKRFWICADGGSISQGWKVFRVAPDMAYGSNGWNYSQSPERTGKYRTIWNQFNVSVSEGVMKITMLPEDKYSFFGIPATYLERNSKLEQNNTWGGPFDPLQ